MRAGGAPGRRRALRSVQEEMMQPASRTEKRTAASPAHGVAPDALLQMRRQRKGGAVWEWDGNWEIRA
nr:unnamed protein product [Digitaria exilis]